MHWVANPLLTVLAVERNGFEKWFCIQQNLGYKTLSFPCPPLEAPHLCQFSGQTLVPGMGS